jgi:superfamily II DNA or RNA helicase
MTTNTEKGTKYEIFIRDFLKNDDTNNIAWLWKDIPELHLRKINILGNWNEFRLFRKQMKETEKKENILIDTGCDILLKNNDKYTIIQCKNYTNNNITIECLAGFYMTLCHYDLDGIVYYTSKLSNNIIIQKPTNKIQYIKKNFTEIILNDNEKENNSNIIDRPYDYKIIALQNIKKEFQNKNRAILQLPCGLGKTLISMLVGLDYDQVIILSPLKQYCVQNLERFKSELKYKDYQELIIDSENCRDLDYLAKFIKNNKKIFLSICYKSCDILYEILNKLNNYIIIVDEFHNISKNDLIGIKDNKIYEVLMSKSKILFMSATPRFFDLYEDEEEDTEQTEDILSKEIFGNVVYTYNMGDAIKNKLICDYEVYVPDITINNQQYISNIQNEVDVSKFDNDNLVKSNFIIRGMLETGARKNIIYANTQKNAFEFREILLELSKYFAVEIYAETILSMDKNNERKQKIDNFKNFNGLAFLISVEILNECFDMKECDSVYFTYKFLSLILITQRFSRPNRIDSNNIHKVSKIFIWNNEYDDMTEIIANMKEFDNSFNIEKIKILSLNDNDYQVLERSSNLKKYEVLDNFVLKFHAIEK